MGGPKITIPAPAPVTQPRQRIVVTPENYEETLGGVIDSKSLYLIDGDIVCGGVPIVVPATGVTIAGLGANLSSLTCSDAAFTLLTSPVGGSGYVSIQDLTVRVTGAGSQVYDLEDTDGTHLVAVTRVRFEDCSSLGSLNGYAEGHEHGTVRVGGKPELTLKGHWEGGYGLMDSHAGELLDGNYALFKTGAGFSMSTSFHTDITCDLPSLAAFMDFAEAAFVLDVSGNPATLHIQEAHISRDGVTDATDPNLIPNVDQTLVVCKWHDNRGLSNTFEGGVQTVSAETTTIITTAATFETLLATWLPTNQEHFDSPASGQLRHLSVTPREYRTTINFVLESNQNNQLAIRLRKWDDSASVFVDATPVVRQVNQLAGSRDVAIFNFVSRILLDKNDYVFWQVANNSGTANVTAELDSNWLLEAR